MRVVYLILVLLDLVSEAPIAEASSLPMVSATVLVNYIVSSAIFFITISLHKRALLLIAFVHSAYVVVCVSIMVGRLLRCVIGWRLHRWMSAIAQAIVAVL